MARIIRSPEADADVDDIAFYIARDNLDAALRWIQLIDAKLIMLARFPGAGRSREDLAKGLRSFPVGSYVILYRSMAPGIEVVRVVHGARNLRKLFRKRPKP